MVLYAVFKALGIKVEILPVLEYNRKYQTEIEDLKLSGMVSDVSSSGYLTEDEDYYDDDDDDDDSGVGKKQWPSWRKGWKVFQRIRHY